MFAAALGIPEWRSFVSPFDPREHEGELVPLSREFLEACLERRLSQEDPIVLDPRQREFLEVVAASVPFGDVVMVPEELLRAFLAGNDSPRAPNTEDLQGEDHPS